MTIVQGKDAYDYGVLFSLVREQLSILESAKYKKPGMWAAARAASREAKIEKIITKILKKKFDSLSPSDALNSLNEELIFMVQNTDVWDEVNDEQANYIGDIIRKMSAKTYI